MNDGAAESIICAIQNSRDESEVRMLTDQYSRGESKDNLTLQERESVRIAGIARWGELRGIQGRIIGFEVRRNYAIGELIEEMSMKPLDNIYRTRNVTGGNNLRVKDEGLGYGLKRAFEIVFRTGRQMYGEKFTPAIATDAFRDVCPYDWARESYTSAVPRWFNECDVNARTSEGAD